MEKSILPLSEALSNPDVFNEEIEKLSKPPMSKNLIRLLAESKELAKRKSGEIQFSPPFLIHGDKAILFPNTINVIQGQAGVHKSRMAEIVCAAVLQTPESDSNLLGFQKNGHQDFTVAYVDTERNTKDQFPAALQRIQRLAGFGKKDNPPNFEFCSLVPFDRAERFQMLTEFIDHIRRKNSQPILIILDVITDCIGDFNAASDSLSLIDMMNRAIIELNVTFLCIIHENPGSEKARGHIGTELINKSSTVIQVSYASEPTESDPGLIKIAYKKCRSTQKHLPFHTKYCKEERCLVLADNTEVMKATSNRQTKASLYEVRDELATLLSDNELSRENLLSSLTTKFDASERSIEKRLSELITSNVEIVIKTESEPQTKYLNKFSKGKPVWYRLSSSPTHSKE
ncbi:MAG: hypothetical protein ACPGU4_13355 [Flavobacteriales bacterium]